MRPLDPTPLLQPHYGPSSLLRVGPPQCSASVRSPRGFGRLGFLPSHQSDWFLQFHAIACIRFTPSLRRSPSAQSSGIQRTCQVNHTLPVLTTLRFLTTRLRRVHFRSSL